jgi:di/tricarboxylate transporter
MTAPQVLAFALIGAAVALFAWGRFRYDLISLGVLLVAVLTGDVKPDEAFSGFTSDVVVIIACALVLSAAVSRSGVIEPLVRPLIARLKHPQSQVPVLSGATALLAMVTKNVGALAMLMPVAIRLGRSKDSSPSALLMPMAFLSLMGGLVTLVGTSTNIIVSQVRKDTVGEPFQMFDFAPVGLALTAIGLIVVSFAWRLLPRNRTPRAALSEVHADVAYVTEAVLPEGWPEQYATLDKLGLGDAGLRLVALLGPDGRPRTPFPDARLEAGMTLLLEGDDAALGTLIAQLPLEHVYAHRDVPVEEAHEELRGIEAVIEAGSPLVGVSARRFELRRRYGVKLLAIGRKGARISRRLADEKLCAGDLLMLQAAEGSIAGSLRDLGLLPLAERSVTIGDARWRWLPLVAMIGAIVLVALKVLPVAIAFFAAAVLVIAAGSLSMREAYGALEPEVLVLIGALTPLSEAVQHSGGTALVGAALGQAMAGLAPLFVLGGMMLAAMACAPFLHNAPTVLVLAPIGVALAQRLGLNPDAFLMAVATGAGCDFLTPIGHQCNTLVRGPGGYRFGDYWRLGLPLSVVVIVCGTPLIAWVWGL